MPKKLILTKDAEQDLNGAYRWYQEQDQGLGQEFFRCIDAKLSEISRTPLHYQIVYKDRVHRALSKRFPFSIYYINDEEVIIVFAILHQRRSPEKWKSRS